MNVQLLQLPPDQPNLDALDAFLRSESAPLNWMTLSELDGFLTGIIVGPERLMPSSWLPIIFGGKVPAITDEAEAKTIFGAIMGRYDEVLRHIEESRPEPLFWIDRDGKVLAQDWALGFMRAVRWRLKSWEELFHSNHANDLLFPIVSLCRNKNGQSLLGLEPEDDEWAMPLSTELLPSCVLGIHAYWRLDHVDVPYVNPLRDVRRNDPCPCGSSRKFKKCCGRND